MRTWGVREAPHRVGKRLELLKETLPKLSRVGILLNPDFAPNQSRLALGLTIIPVDARGLDGLEPGLPILVRERVEPLVVLGDAVLYDYRSQIGLTALKNSLPSISGAKAFAEAGLLQITGLTFETSFAEPHCSLKKSSRDEVPPICPSNSRPSSNYS